MAISSELTSLQEPQEDRKPPLLPLLHKTKNQNTVSRLVDILQTHPATFKHLSPVELETLLMCFQEVRGGAGDEIVGEGQESDSFYILESGHLNCTKTFKGHGYATTLRSYAPGDSFGILCLYQRVKQAVTVRAATDFVLWRLDRHSYQFTIQNHALRNRLKTHCFLKQIPSLRDSLSEQQIWALNDVAEIVTMKKS